jgi:glycosyltransferase involved in cell wall biosynthesis
MSAPASTPSVSVVVPTYRRSHLLPRLVAALEAQTLPVEQFEVLIVDDCSGDGTAEVLADVGGRSPLTLRVLTTPVNGGPAVARNLGWRAARAPYVAFTDDDCVPRPDWLDQGLRACQVTPRLGVLQGATVLPREHPQRGPLSVYREILGPSPYFEGCNLFFPRKVLEETGGFDETLPLAGEDTVAGWRALEGDREWVFDETTVVAHDVTERPLRWHLMMAFREGNTVDVARRHPELRRAFWRPWAHRRSNVAFAAGAVGLVAAVRWRPAALATLPWLWMRCPPLTHHGALPTFAFRLANDAAVCAGMVAASARNRTLVL